jgi:hypothetical protein
MFSYMVFAWYESRRDFEETILLFGEASGEKLLRVQLWPTL